MRLLNTLTNTLKVANSEPSANAGITVDTAFDLLSNSRRRCVISVLADLEDEITVRELSHRLADKEDGTSRKAMYIALYQSHLPVLADGENPVIEYDARAGVVAPTEACYLLNRVCADSQELLNG